MSLSESELYAAYRGMSIRRYQSLKPSRGTVIPSALRAEVIAADGHLCVGPRVGMNPFWCRNYGLELDHVRASHGIGMKSATERGNLVSLCANCHREKTDHGRTWRPKLLDYIEKRDREYLRGVSV